MEKQFDTQYILRAAEALKKNDAAAWEQLQARFTAFFLQTYRDKTKPEIELIDGHAELQTNFYALAKADFSTALELLAFDFGQENLKDAFPNQCAEIEIARKARKQQELEEKVRGFRKKNFETYRKVYEALA